MFFKFSFLRQALLHTPETCIRGFLEKYIPSNSQSGFQPVLSEWVHDRLAHQPGITNYGQHSTAKNHKSYDKNHPRHNFSRQRDIFLTELTTGRPHEFKNYDPGCETQKTNQVTTKTQSSLFVHTMRQEIKTVHLQLEYKKCIVFSI